MSAPSWAAPIPEAGLERVVVRFGAPADVPPEGSAFLGATVVRAIPSLAAAAVLAPPGFAGSARGHPAVRAVEADVAGRAMLTPSDPHWGAQSGFRAIRADVAWDLATGGEDTIVAVVDTGVDVAHPDLRANLWTGPSGEHGWNAIANSSDVADAHGHGTHVAGIVAAVLGNGEGVAGLAQVDLMVVKALGADGTGFASDVAAGLDWASARGARVACLALAFPSASAVLGDAVALATSRGALVVAAAGDRSVAPGVEWPAAHADALAVGALDASGAPASFSPAGPEMDLAAPGVAALSTTPTYAVTLTSTGLAPNYDDASGTSVAAAHVAGVAALVAAADPTLSAGALRAVLESRAADVAASGFDADTGAGRVDARASLASLDVAPEARPGGPYVVDEGSPVTLSAARSRGLGLSFEWDLDDDSVVDATTRDVTVAYADDRVSIARLTVRNATGVSSTATTPLQVRNVAPAVAVARDVVNVTLGRAVTLSGSASDVGSDPLVATWDFGDAASAAGFSVSRTYPALGEFDAVLRVTDDEGGIGLATTRVNVRGVDLLVSSVTFETPRVAGVVPLVTQRLLHARIANDGPLDVDAPFRVRFTYSVGNRTGTLGDVIVPSIAGHASLVATYTWNATGRFGDYHVRATVDPANAVAEGDDSNNVAGASLTLVASDPTGGRLATAVDAAIGGSGLATTDEPGDYDTDGLPDRGDAVNLPSESRVRSAARDFMEIPLRPGAAATLVAPDGKVMSVRGSASAAVVRIFFNGTVDGVHAGGVEVTGDLVSAAADGTWTLTRPLDASGRPTGYSLTVAGKRLDGISVADGGEAWGTIAWNWHMQREVARSRGPSTIGGIIVDPAESPVFARYYASDLSAVALPA